MTYLVAVLIGVLVGVITGYAAEHVPVTPLVQSVSAAVVSNVIASIGSAMVWVMRPPPDAGVAAVSIGIVEGAVTCAGVVVVAVAMHLVLGRMSGAVHPALTGHRGIILGLLGGLTGALASAAGLRGVHPLRQSLRRTGAAWGAG